MTMTSAPLFRRRLLHVALALLAACSWVVPAGAQEAYQISGRVIDVATGAGLASVSVALRGTSLGTVTDENGGFVLEANVPSGAYVLELSSIGRRTATRSLQLGAQRNVSVGAVALEESVVELEELVVTGTGSAVERRELGNTVESVSGREIAEAPGVSTVDQALQGKVTGALISENSGQPGGGVSIRLRGTSSILGGAEPLIVVDGVIIDNSSEALIPLGANATYQGASVTNRLADIAPEDIARVEIVKGGAAAALYGSRANNGVIQIFTRRGQQGATRVTAGGEFSWSRTPERYDLNMVPLATFADVQYSGADSIGAPVERFDIQDEIWQTGFGTGLHTSVSGGSGGTTFYASGSYRDEEGIVRTVGYNRVNGRLNLSQLIGERFTLRGNVGVSNSKASFVPEGEQTQGVLTSAIFTPTSFDYRFDPDLGRYPYNPILGLNPLTALETYVATEDVLHLLGNIEGQWRPLDALELSYLVGLDDYRLENVYLRPRYAEGPGFLGSIQNPIRLSRSINHNVTANHDWALGGGMTLTSTAGTRYSSSDTDEVRAAASDLTPGQTTVGGAVVSAAQSLTQFRTFGVFLQEHLNVGDRLYLTGAINYEGSSAFGEDERWQMFPKFGASYVLTEEPALQNSFLTDWFSIVRLRAAYGETGGQPPFVYSRFDNFLPFSYGNLPALAPSDLAGNPDLKPERERELEGGIDLGLLGGRVQLELTAYDQTTDDLVLSVALPPSIGRQSQFRNIGDLTNTGFEAALETVNLDRDNFSWRSRLQYARNENRVEQLVTDGDTIQVGYLNAVIEGHPAGVFIGGIYARGADGEILYNDAGLPLRARDTLPDGTTPFARRTIGDPNPDFTLSFSNTFSIGENLELSMLLDGRFGNDVANFSRRIAELFGAAAVTSREATGDTVSRTYILSPTSRAGIYEEYIEDGSFVKLREVAVSYRFGQGWVQDYVRAESLTVRVAGRNLYTWTDYSGLDPEVNLFSANTVARGVDFGTTPVPRSVVVGFNVVF